MRLSLTILALVLAAGCSRPPTGTALFCAYGAVGMQPFPRPPEFEGELAVVVVEVKNPGPPVAVVVKDVVLVDAHGTTTAMRRVQAVEVLSVADPAPSSRASGSFGYYLNPGGHPFDGTLRAGSTRLRIRISLQTWPAAPERFRLTLGGFETPLVIEGSVDGAWPS
jgi:hypothetical protein